MTSKHPALPTMSLLSPQRASPSVPMAIFTLLKVTHTISIVSELFPPMVTSTTSLEPSPNATVERLTDVNATTPVSCWLPRLCSVIQPPSL